MKALDRFVKGDVHGIHYALSIFFASMVLWFLVHKLGKANPVWAISSMVATSDPLMKQAVLFLRSRMINTLVGCGVGQRRQRCPRVDASSQCAGARRRFRLASPAKRRPRRFSVRHIVPRRRRDGDGTAGFDFAAGGTGGRGQNGHLEALGEQRDPEASRRDHRCGRFDAGAEQAGGKLSGQTILVRRQRRAVAR